MLKNVALWKQSNSVPLTKHSQCQPSFHQDPTANKSSFIPTPPWCPSKEQFCRTGEWDKFTLLSPGESDLTLSTCSWSHYQDNPTLIRSFLFEIPVAPSSHGPDWWTWNPPDQNIIWMCREKHMEFKQENLGARVSISHLFLDRIFNISLSKCPINLSLNSGEPLNFEVCAKGNSTWPLLCSTTPDKDFQICRSDWWASNYPHN